MTNSVAAFLRQPLLWAAIGVVVGSFFVIYGLRIYRLRFRILHSPARGNSSTLPIWVRVSGKAVGPYTVTAPLSKEECLYYRLVRVRDPYNRFGNRIREASVPLFVDDGNETLLINPFGAKLRMGPSHETGNFNRALSGYQGGGDPEFVQEYSIRPGDTLFVFGMLQENAYNGKANLETELSRVGPGFLSKDESDLLRTEALPFLDPELPTIESETNRTFDLYPSVILAQGKDPVLMANEEKELLTNLGRNCSLSLTVGIALCAWAFWQILSCSGFSRLLAHAR